ncbi:tetratricopeptide repeat protein [Cryptosporangium minutisporangium]|uniref:Tetratricopeptide repeat protein n=1 Tax=Cryptosporangium minutisporangium TaxID=113569 RepID=A0ABP6T1K7_9ACTN
MSTDGPGSVEEQLQRLEEEVRAEGTIDAWSHFAAVLADNGYPGPALEYLRTLWADAMAASALDEEETSSLVESLFLASSLARREDLDGYADLLLRRAAAVTTKPSLREAAQERLAAAAERRVAENTDRRLHELQWADLIEQRRLWSLGVEDYLRLTDLTLRVGATDELGSRLRSALAECVDGLREHPDAAPLLEYYAELLRVLGCAAELDEALRRLERVDPSSAVLAHLARAPLSDPASLSDRSMGVWRFLMSIAGSSDTSEAAAALHDFRVAVELSPLVRPLRVFYIYALWDAGERDAAREQVRLLESVADETHISHYNLAHVYRYTDQPSDALHHAELARRYATTDQDRADADDLIAEWRA